MLLNLISFLGLLTFVAMAWAMSSHRKNVNFRMVAVGLGLQLVLGLLILGIPALDLGGPLAFVFRASNDAVVALLNFSESGARFIFGDLVDQSKYGFIVMAQVLPVIIFMSALMAVLYHLGIMQYVVDFFAWIMQKLLRVSGAESLSASANIFFGQTEAPLVIRPFITRMTNSELFCVMVGGFATVAGSVLGAYTGLLRERIPDIAGHLITASVLSAPAALVIAKLMLPETEKPETMGKVPEEYRSKKLDTNIVEALARGASEGLYLALNVAAMLIAFIAVIAVVDGILGTIGDWMNFPSWGAALIPDQLVVDGETPRLTLSLIFGWLFSPLAWLMGIPWSDVPVAGVLLGQKTALNEFVAYMNLSQLMSQLNERTVIILSYALCGFANFSSIGIQIGGIGVIAPNRKTDLAKLGLKAMIGGTLAAFMTAAIAGLLI